MACFSYLFSKRKKRNPDTELNRLSSFNSNYSEESPNPPLYAPNKELFNPLPPELKNIEIISESQNFEFLSNPKAFLDYFVSLCERTLPSSDLVVSQTSNFEKLLEMEASDD